MEVEIGLMLLLLFSNMDAQIKLTNDKRKLVERTWASVSKYFSNHGRIKQNLDKLKVCLDHDRILNNHMESLQ